MPLQKLWRQNANPWCDDRVSPDEGQRQVLDEHGAERALKAAITIEDFRVAARRRLPRVVFDYIDGGSGAEITMRENCRVFEHVTFRPRNAAAGTVCSLGTTVLGVPIELPFLLAPVGSSRLFYPRGECVAAAEAGRAGTIYTLSTLSGCRLEEVRAAASGQLWYQLYLLGGREAASDAIRRARGAGYSALVVTIDTAVSGQRERDIRNGASALAGRRFWAKLPYLPQVLARPRWVIDLLRDGGMMTFPNVLIPGQGAMPYEDVGAALERSTVTWADMEWIRALWNGPIVIKGVLTAEDARRSIEVGAEAIVVSNHGGRQLDGVSATLRALPEVVEAAGGRAEILLDGGIRRGSDVVKALCLGARAVLIGRAYAYALGAAGGAGVARAIEILRSDIVRTLRLLGCYDVGSLDRSYVES
jgi:isopentenyl diphosphate isomerase/L-lactate dehydrogenase-like FMN-dependent dehydrogenase